MAVKPYPSPALSIINTTLAFANSPNHGDIGGARLLRIGMRDME